jgi:hypothetical protein
LLKKLKQRFWALTKEAGGWKEDQLPRVKIQCALQVIEAVTIVEDILSVIE